MRIFKFMVLVNLSIVMNTHRKLLWLYYGFDYDFYFGLGLYLGETSSKSFFLFILVHIESLEEAILLWSQRYIVNDDHQHICRIHRGLYTLSYKFFHLVGESEWKWRGLKSNWSRSSLEQTVKTHKRHRHRRRHEERRSEGKPAGSSLWVHNHNEFRVSLHR